MNPNNINNQNENQGRNQTFSNVHPPISREPAISNPNIMSRDYDGQRKFFSGRV